MKLTREQQIAVQSSVEISAVLMAMIEELHARDVKYLGRKPNRQAVVNGVLLWLATLSVDDRQGVLVDAIKKLEDAVQGRVESGEGWSRRVDALIAGHLASQYGGGYVEPVAARGSVADDFRPLLPDRPGKALDEKPARKDRPVPKRDDVPAVKKRRS